MGLAQYARNTADVSLALISSRLGSLTALVPFLRDKLRAALIRLAEACPSGTGAWLAESAGRQRDAIEDDAQPARATRTGDGKAGDRTGPDALLQPCTAAARRGDPRLGDSPNASQKRAPKGAKNLLLAGTWSCGHRSVLAQKEQNARNLFASSANA